jgi:RimJ/RimL family protein N-acetyltransferase
MRQTREWHRDPELPDPKHGRLVEYANFVRKLRLPPGRAAPRRLVYDDIEARVLTRDDLEDDVAGINTSVELIQATRGGGWPTGPVTGEEDFVDLVWHELEFRDGYSFSYAVYDSQGLYLGCCYFYPMGRRTELTSALLDHDVDVSWWVTPDAYERGYYEKLYTALSEWAVAELGFLAPYYSNLEIPT